MVGLLGNLQHHYKKYGANHSQDLARKWLLAKTQDLRVNRAALMRAGTNRNSVVVGRMYFFYYDPKTKETMEYYDRFPLIFPIEVYGDGSFLGLNLHYISPQLRLLLVDKLSEYRNNSKYDSSTKLRLSYQLLQGAKRFRTARPCIKKYLNNHVQSKFLEIPADEYDIACLIQSEWFMKANKTKVWKDSEQKSHW